MSQQDRELEELLRNLSLPAHPGKEHDTGDTPVIPRQEGEEPEHIYHIFPTEDGLGFSVYKEEDLLAAQPEDSAVESVPANLPRKPIDASTIIAGVSLVLMALIITCNLVVAVSVLFLETADITVNAREKSVSITQTLQLVTGLPTISGQLHARSLTTITLTQKATTQASGTFHQNPTFALGYVTFYNGEFQSVTIPAGTQLTGSDGIAIMTTQSTVIPGVDQSANPPALGQVTVAARAASIGSGGNIPAYAINGPCCATSVLVKNTQGFTGGQDAKDFQMVTQADIDQLNPLQAQVKDAVSAALASQLRQDETDLPDVCSPQVSVNHKAGDIATSVTATATATCGGMAYNTQALQAAVSDVLTKQALAKLKGYSLVGAIDVTTPQVIRMKGTTLLKVEASGQWAYIPGTKERQQIKNLLAGKTVAQARKILLSLPGSQRVSISGLITATLPADTNRINLLFFYT